jgi:uncharacterized Zn ribbon protein
MYRRSDKKSGECCKCGTEFFYTPKKKYMLCTTCSSHWKKAYSKDSLVTVEEYEKQRR